jgi:hypothetical protein
MQLRYPRKCSARAVRESGTPIPLKLPPSEEQIGFWCIRFPDTDGRVHRKGDRYEREG